MSLSLSVYECVCVCFRFSYEQMILDCVAEMEASLVICHAEHVFAIIAFQDRKTQSGEI